MTNHAAAIEAILFTAHRPVTVHELASLIDLDLDTTESAVTELENELNITGLRLSRHDDGLRLVTASVHETVVARALSESGRTELTKPLLETLSIVAYRGPISRSAIEAIRGVNSEATLRNLLARDLIKTNGVASEPGKPPLYVVSTEFLDHFGLTATSELPQIEVASGGNDQA